MELQAVTTTINDDGTYTYTETQYRADNTREHVMEGPMQVGWFNGENCVQTRYLADGKTIEYVMEGPMRGSSFNGENCVRIWYRADNTRECVTSGPMQGCKFNGENCVQIWYRADNTRECVTSGPMQGCKFHGAKQNGFIITRFKKSPQTSQGSPREEVLESKTILSNCNDGEFSGVGTTTVYNPNGKVTLEIVGLVDHFGFPKQDVDQYVSFIHENGNPPTIYRGKVDNGLELRREEAIPVVFTTILGNHGRNLKARHPLTSPPLNANLKPRNSLRQPR